MTLLFIYIFHRSKSAGFSQNVVSRIKVLQLLISNGFPCASRLMHFAQLCTMLIGSFNPRCGNYFLKVNLAFQLIIQTREERNLLLTALLMQPKCNKRIVLFQFALLCYFLSSEKNKNVIPFHDRERIPLFKKYEKITQIKKQRKTSKRFPNRKIKMNSNQERKIFQSELLN